MSKSIDTLKKDYFKNWYNSNLERERTKRRERAQKLRKENPKARMLYAAKERAKKLNLPFSITTEDFEIPSHCPILGHKLVLGGKRSAPSLDRIIPTLGYVKNNVWVISMQANVMKNNATKQELMDFAQWVMKTNV